MDQNYLIEIYGTLCRNCGLMILVGTDERSIQHFVSVVRQKYSACTEAEADLPDLLEACAKKKDAAVYCDRKRKQSSGRR